MELNDLSPLVLQSFITELLQSGNRKTGKGLSANSVNAVISVIQSSFKTAHLLGLTKEYTADKLKRPNRLSYYTRKRKNAGDRSKRKSIEIKGFHQRNTRIKVYPERKSGEHPRRFGVGDFG